MEEAHGDVISRTTPSLDREQVRGHAGYGFGCRNQGGTTHAGSKQGLVSVAEGGIRNHQRILLADLLRPLLRAKLEQVIAGTARERLGKVQLRELIKRTQSRRTLTVGLINGGLCDVLEDATRFVDCRRSLEQVRVCVDESGVHAGLSEVRFAQQGAQEADIGGHAGDGELVERTLGALHGLLESDSTAGHLHQQRVEVGRNLSTHGRCTVQAHAGAARRTIRGQRAGIGTEAVIRVLGGDATLQGRTGDGNLVLGEVNIFQRCAGRDIHLGLDDVYAGDFLGHGVLHLHTRVHLDKDVVAALIHEEFHGTRALIVDVLAELHRILADAVTQLWV